MRFTRVVSSKSPIATIVLAVGAIAIAPVARAGMSPPESSNAPGLENPLPPVIGRSSVKVQLQTITSSLVSPVTMTDAGDGSGREFVVDQTGEVRIIKDGKLVSTPFLDVRSQLVKLMPQYDERGLLGLAFDPNFKKNGKLYTYFTAPPNSGKADFTDPYLNGATPDHQGVLAEWKVDPKNPDRVDPSSERVLLRFDHPNFNHNGGQLSFGPDKMLYMTVGDGGGADDQQGQALEGGDVTRGKAPQGNAQVLNVLQGKVLRIDPNGHNSRNGRYGIPAGNPFVGQSGKLGEIYAYGLRNPYRFSFDKATGKLIAADAGQDSVEEVDVIHKGGNYGWHVKEGSFLFNPLSTTENGVVTKNSFGNPPGLIDPVAEYDHDEGHAIVGGYVYRGSKISGLRADYVFGDFGGEGSGNAPPAGRLFETDLTRGKGVIKELIPTNAPSASSSAPGTAQASSGGGESEGEHAGIGYFVRGFGRDASGELYVLATDSQGLDGKGYVLAIRPSGSAGGTGSGSGGGGPSAVPLPPAAATGAIGLVGTLWVARRRGVLKSG